jgi:hypothetical protein
MLWIALKQKQLPTSFTTILRTAAPILLTAVLILLPLVPWTLRNWHTFHVFEPLAPRNANDPGEAVPVGFNRWYRTWGLDFASTEEVYWNYNGTPIAIGDLPERAFDTHDQYALTAALFTDYNQTTNATPGLDARFADLARTRIHADPLRYYVALPVARLLNMAFRPRTEMFNIQLEWWKLSAHPAQTIFATAYGALNLAYFILAGIGLYRRRSLAPSPRLAAAAPILGSMLASIGLRSALLLTLDNSEPRYTLEFFPVLIVFASIMFKPELQLPKSRVKFSSLCRSTSQGRRPDT